jgi:glycosyltransferase involved in cell wall biosynthesis
MPITSTHIVPTINNEASGPSYSVTSLCRALISAGQPTKLAVLEPLPESDALGFAHAFPYGVGPKRLGISPRMKRWLRAEAQSGRSQILHNHSLWMFPNLYPALAVKGTSCKLVISPRGTLSDWALGNSALFKKALWPLLVGPIMRGATAFHATADTEYEDIRRLGFKQPVAVIPNGVDIPDLKVKPSKPVRDLLFISRIHPKKGIDNLLRAWARTQDRFADWQLVVAGPDNGGYLEKMKRLSRELRLKRCEFPGPLYGDDKLQAYRDADLYVLPTHSENFGMTVAEALAAGTPAIVTKGAPWAGLEREGAGWWTDIGVDPLVAALEEAFSMPADGLEVKGQRARDWMARDFSWEKIAENMAIYYGWIAGGGKVPPFVYVD